jgi:hypothetical protein
MNRSVVNALLNLTAAVLFLAMLMTGVVLQFVLAPGTGGIWQLWSLERHDWSALHAYASALLLVVLVVHVALHWRWVAAIVNKRLGDRSVSSQTLAAAVIAGVGIALLAFTGAAYLSRAPRTAGAPQSLALPEVERAPSAPGQTSYARDIAPVLAQRCVGCHDEQRAKAGVLLHDYAAVRASAQPGGSAASRLLSMLRDPMDATHTLDDATVALFERWVSEGAAP